MPAVAWAVLKWVGGKLLLPILLLAAAYFVGRQAGSLAERVAWQQATAKAEHQAQAHKDRVDAARAAATVESTNDINGKLADALARATAHAARVRASAGPHVDLPGIADAAGGVDGAGQAAILAANDDDAVCAENTIKAQGWQDWWISIRGTDDAGSTSN